MLPYPTGMHSFVFPTQVNTAKDLAIALLAFGIVALLGYLGTLRTDLAGLKDTSCDPNSVDLHDSPQWVDEKGYWLGEYTLLGINGDATTSSSWNYPYDHYKGFITGDINGNRYSQRNIFMYPPQDPTVCNGGNDAQGAAGTNATQGEGVCGVNGNIKVFEADQEATTCDTKEPGAIEGPYGSLSYTYSTMIGKVRFWLTRASVNLRLNGLLRPRLMCDRDA